MSKVRVLANYNIADLWLRKGKEAVIDKADAELYSKKKIMYMQDYMLTIIGKDEAPVEKKPLSKMNKTELLEVCKGLDIVVDETLTNKNLVELIESQD